MHKADPEKEYALEEIVESVFSQLRFVAGCTKDEVRQILKQKHLENGKTEGKYLIKEQQALSISDAALLDMFNEKLLNVKESVKNLSCDFSTWQATFMEKAREIRGIGERLADLEEQQEDINLESLEGKESVSIAEIIKTIKNL